VAAKIVYEQQGRQVVVPLDKDVVTIGRDHRNDVVIERPSVSRKHAQLARDGEGWRVVDVGSAYGTRVNDLGHTDKILKDGDRILLHDFPLVFSEGEGASGAALLDHAGSAPEFGAETVFQNTVDFSSLASDSADVSHLQRLLVVVSRTSEVMLASRSIDETFQKVLDLVFDHLPVQRGFIMLRGDDRRDLVTKCVKHKSLSDSGEKIEFSRTIAEKVVRDKVAVLTTDAQSDDRFAAGASIVHLGIRSAMAAPLWSGDNVDGLIYVDTPLQAKAFDKFDLDLLSALGNQVAVAIEQSRLQSSFMEQKLVRRRLERYHSPAVIERITSSSAAEDTLTADEREVTVLFADIVGFTKRCENLEPREIAELLNRYFSGMAEVVFRHEGTLDKFIGDCLMAVFGAPLPDPAHARRAVETALDMREALERINEPLSEEEQVRFRVGIHSGMVIAGDIGSPSQRDYTVLGQTVNLAARIESTIAQPGQIVISEATADELDDAFEIRLAGEHRPKGISRSVRCFEVVGRK
jgi:adenylate cyclase